MNTYKICYEAPDEERWKGEIKLFAKQREEHFESLAAPFLWADAHFFITEWPDDPTTSILKFSDESVEEARRRINPETVIHFDALVKQFGKKAINDSQVVLQVFKKGALKKQEKKEAK